MTRPEIPRPGAACNGCGVCCEAQLCPIALKVLDRTVEENDGPCPMLEENLGGTRSCGMLRAPEQYAPVLVSIWGRDAVLAAGRHILGVGAGCTSEPVRATTEEYRRLERAFAEIRDRTPLADQAQAFAIFPVPDFYVE